ncbi:MAG TPA: SUMF1/EgtB/PvdO family nonheme iron enzyme [Thermoanaerobaculia bacterium]
MPESREPQFKYRAFLSYRAADARQAAWLHRKLEAYAVPRSLAGTRGDYGTIPRRLGRIFRDRDEVRSAEHIEHVIAEELSQSQHLLVLCTPNAVAPGSWVPREIALFRQRRPDGPIHAVIGAGTPPEVFPPALLTTHPDGRAEAPLAADLRPIKDGGADGEQRALIRLIAGILGVRFDELWQGEERRKRIRRVLRTLEVAAVAAVVVAAIALGNLYRTRAMVSVELGSVFAAADDVRIVVTEELPDENRSKVFLDEAANGPNVTRWIPASNVVLRVAGTYRDGADRSVSWHLDLNPGFSLKSKRIQLVAPSTREILAHPGMAHIPATTWVHGHDAEMRTNARPYWIDVRPPTVREYLSVADRLLNSGELSRDSSFVLTARQQSAAVDATGLGQIRSLGKDLGAVFGVIAQGTSTNVSASGDIVVGLVALPCDTCPAPMTRHEAEVYCRSRGMRLPTAVEWELAVRGVDGRVYPWGNRFDPTRANVRGLPEKGAVPLALTPVDVHRGQRSPFGLYDTVGNAGDWVVNDITPYERAYMGATYRFNPEDATAFRLLPVTDSDYLIREITARCVSNAK